MLTALHRQPLPFQPLQADKKEGESEGAAEVQQFDHFLGNDAGAFVFGEYDEDDREADQVWDKIDDAMDERRKVRRGAKGRSRT